MGMTFISLPILAQDLKDGKTTYRTCQVCHGDKGQGLLALEGPALAGQYDWYLTRQMEYFRTDVRGTDENDPFSQQMAGMAVMVSDDTQVSNVIAYIGTLKSTDTGVTIKGSKKRGKKIYQNCITCHGLRAAGEPDTGAPNLAILNDWYVYKQMKNFDSKLRGTHKKDKWGKLMMEQAIFPSDTQGMMDVTVYIRSKRRK